MFKSKTLGALVALIITLIVILTIVILSNSQNSFNSSLETRLEELGNEWDQAQAQSKTNLEARNHYQTQYDINIESMETSNVEANKIRELLGQDFQ